MLLDLNKIFNFPPNFLEASGDGHLTKLNISSFDRKISNKPSLVVTIGDSWTFGGSLWYLFPYSASGEEINKFRLDNIFGSYLSQDLDADWINISLPFMSNFWIAKQLENLNSVLDQLDYDKIYIVVTLTEVGRELMDIGLFNYHVGTTYKSIQDLIDTISKQVEDRILSCKLDSRCKLVVGRTYIDDSYPNLKPVMLADSWLELVVGNPVNSKCFFIGHRVVDTVKQSVDNGLAEILDVFPNIEKRIDMLSQSKYNIQKEHYRHPNPEGHRIWATYILNKLNETKDN